MERDFPQAYELYKADNVMIDIDYESRTPINEEVAREFSLSPAQKILENSPNLPLKVRIKLMSQAAETNWY